MSLFSFFGEIALFKAIMNLFKSGSTSRVALPAPKIGDDVDLDCWDDYFMAHPNEYRRYCNHDVDYLDVSGDYDYGSQCFFDIDDHDDADQFDMDFNDDL